MKKVKDMLIALVQTAIKDFDIESNLRYFTKICKDISSEVEWIILPEMFITGFVADTSLSIQSKAKGLEFMRNLSKQKECGVEGSLMVEEDGKYYNRHYLITDTAEFMYDKQKLFSLSKEAEALCAGNKECIARLGDYNVSLRTCYDLRFADICKNGYSNGRFKYDIMTFVASWPKSRSEQWKILLKARAIENMCYVIGVNRVGKDANGLEYVGESCVINSKGEELKPLENSTQEILYYDISKEYLDSMRKKFPVYMDW